MMAKSRIKFGAGIFGVLWLGVAMGLLAQNTSPDPLKLLNDSDTARAEGRYGDAALLCLVVQEDSPRTEYSYRANNRLRIIEEAFLQGQISSEELAKFEADIPSIDAPVSPEAKLTIIDYYTMKADQLDDSGDNQGALALHQQIHDAALPAIQQDDSDPALVGLVWRYVESSEQLGPQALADARANIVALITSGEPTIRSWVCRWVESHYVEYGHENRSTLKQTYAKLLTDVDSPALQALLNGLYVDDWIKAECLYGVGHAHFRLGHHAEALSIFDYVATNLPDQGIASVKSSYAAAVTRQVMAPNDPDAGIAALEQHLAAYADSPYRAKVHLREGKLNERKRDFSQAITKYDDVIQEAPLSTEASEAMQRKVDLTQ